MPAHESEESGLDYRLEDSHVSFRFRFQENRDSDFLLSLRRNHATDTSVEVGISQDTIHYMEISRGEERTSKHTRVDIGEGKWVDLDLFLAGKTLLLYINDKERFRFADVGIEEPGGIVLGSPGPLDLDSIEIRTLDYPLVENQTRELQIKAGKVRTPAFEIISLEDTFTKTKLPSWWIPYGTVEPGSAPEDSSPDNGTITFLPAEHHQEITGLLSRYPVSGDFSFTIRTQPLSYENSLIIGFGCSTLYSGYLIDLSRENFYLNYYENGEGTILERFPFSDTVHAASGDQQTVTLVVKNRNGYLFIEDTLLHRFELPAYTGGRVFAGFEGHEESTRISTISVEHEISDITLPEQPGVDPRTVILPDFPKPPSPVIDDFESGNTWHVNTNRASTCKAAVTYDGQREGNVLELDFTMKEGQGLHVNAGKEIEYDISEYGGVEFWARAEGFERAHFSIAESALYSDRMDAFFTVTPEWTHYRLPFNDNVFTYFESTLLSGADGSMDFSHISHLMFEIFGYQGQGKLLIDDLRLLPHSAKERLREEIVIEDFESETPVPVLPWRELDSPSDEDARVAVDFSDGAEGSKGCGRFTFKSAGEGGIVYRCDGYLSGAAYEGFAFAIKSESVARCVLEMHEVEPEASIIRPAIERPEIAVPVTNSWVTWEFPFHSRGFSSYADSSLTNGSPDGRLLRGIGFEFYPSRNDRGENIIKLDQVRLYREQTRKEERIKLGLFYPPATESDTAALADVIHSVFDINLQRVVGYEVVSNIQGSKLKDMYTTAKQEDLDFFLIPGFEQQYGGQQEVGLKVYLDVYNTAARMRERRVTKSTSIGTDIFASLDELSVEVIDLLADTELQYAPYITDKGEHTLWKDSLQRRNPYWISYGEKKGEQSNRNPQKRRTGSLSLDAEAGESMLLSEPYLDGIKEFSLEVAPGDGRAAVYWHFLGNSACNSITLNRDRVEVSINGLVSTFALPAAIKTHEWLTLTCTKEESGYAVAVNNTRVGTVEAPETSTGRFGLASQQGTVSFRNLTVKYGG
jgi:hypothetical protein